MRLSAFIFYSFFFLGWHLCVSCSHTGLSWWNEKNWSKVWDEVQKIENESGGFFSPSLIKCFLSSNIPGRVFFFSSAWFPGELVWKACNTSDGLHGVEWVGERGGINLLLFICIYLYPYTWSLWSSQYHRQIPRPSRRFRDCWIAQGEEAGLWLSQIDSCRIQSD